MQGSLKIVATLATVGIVVISTLFVLDLVTVAETKEVLQKILLVLAILTLGGFALSFISKPKA